MHYTYKSMCDIGRNVRCSWPRKRLEFMPAATFYSFFVDDYASSLSGAVKE